MRQRGHRDRLHILRDHEVPALEGGLAAGELHQRQAPARAGTDLGLGIGPGRRHQVDHVVSDWLADVDPLDRLLHRAQGGRVDHLLQ